MKKSRIIGLLGSTWPLASTVCDGSGCSTHLRPLFSSFLSPSSFFSSLYCKPGKNDAFRHKKECRSSTHKCKEGMSERMYPPLLPHNTQQRRMFRSHGLGGGYQYASSLASHKALKISPNSKTGSEEAVRSSMAQGRCVSSVSRTKEAYNKNLVRDRPRQLLRRTDETTLSGLHGTTCDTDNTGSPPWHVKSAPDLLEILRKYRNDVDRASLLGSLRRREQPPQSHEDGLPSQFLAKKRSHIPFLEGAFCRIAQSEPVRKGSDVFHEICRDGMDPANGSHDVMNINGPIEDHAGAKLEVMKTMSLVQEQPYLSSRTVGTDRLDLGPATLRKIDKDDAMQASLAARAANVVAVVSTVERLIPLTSWQRLSIGRAAAEGSLATSAVVNPSPASLSFFKERVPNLKVTSHSAWSMVNLLLKEASLSHEQVARAISMHPWLLAIPDPSRLVRPVLECFHLLEMDPSQIATILMQCPEVFVSSADGDVLPTLSRLTELGISESECATIVVRTPRLLMPGGVELLAGTVAFWLGQGMSRRGLRKFLLDAPEITGMSHHLSQLKLKFLKEHVGFEADDVAAIPRAIQLPLRSVVGPRVAFAQRVGLLVERPRRSLCDEDAPNVEEWSDRDGVLAAGTLGMNGSKNGVGSRRGDGMSVGGVGLDDLVSIPSEDINAYVAFINRRLQQHGALLRVDRDDYVSFSRSWQEQEFAGWISSRASNVLDHYDVDAFEWLENDMHQGYLKGSFYDPDMQKEIEQHLLNRELAWEQQEERELAWKDVWRQWQLDQSERDQTTKKLKLGAKRLARRRLQRVAMAMGQAGTVGREGASRFRMTNFRVAEAAAEEEERLRKVHHHNNKAGARAVLGAEPDIGDDAPDILNRASSAVTRDEVERMGVEGCLAEACPISEIAKAPEPMDLQANRRNSAAVEHIAVEMEGWIRSSPHGAVTKESIDLWASVRGYHGDVAMAAKHLLARQQRAFVIMEPNYLYYKIPKMIWTVPMENSKAKPTIEDAIKSPPLPFLLTGGAKNVNKIAASVLRIVGQQPDGRILRSDEKLFSFGLPEGLEKRRGHRPDGKKYLTNAISVLLEGGFIARRRVRGQPSGPMEVLLVDDGRSC